MAVKDAEEREALLRVAQRHLCHVRVLHPHPPPLHRCRAEAGPALLTAWWLVWDGWMRDRGGVSIGGEWLLLSSRVEGSSQSGSQSVSQATRTILRLLLLDGNTQEVPHPRCCCVLFGLPPATTTLLLLLLVLLPLPLPLPLLPPSPSPLGPAACNTTTV